VEFRALHGVIHYTKPTIITQTAVVQQSGIILARTTFCVVAKFRTEIVETICGTTYDFIGATTTKCQQIDQIMECMCFGNKKECYRLH
jgi:hypothetical protein